MQDYQNLPIDIHTSKLLDWLVDRRHCNIKWQTAVVKIREKISNAIQDMPEHNEIRELLAGSHIHYFHCLKIVEILKATEASTKNIFGRYSSQRMKISRGQQQQQDIERRAAESGVLSAEHQASYRAACKSLGIMGDYIKEELLSLVCDLPTLLNKIAEDCKNLQKAVGFYQSFAEFVCNKHLEPELKMLRYIQTKGNMTVYEWRTGIEPSSREQAQPEHLVENEDAEDVIDWGPEPPENVNFTVAEQPGMTPGVTLDWGDNGSNDTAGWHFVTVADAQEPGQGGDEGGANIDWGDDSTEMPQIEIISSGVECEHIARGQEALLILENPETRDQFIDDLVELEAFLLQRLVDMEEETDVLAIRQLQSAPAELQALTSEAVRSMLSAVRSPLACFTDVQTQQLFLILASPRYVERVAERLQQKLKQARTATKRQEDLLQQQEEIGKEITMLRPKLEKAIDLSRHLQDLIEADISKRYNNRPVNLMGTMA
uniref:CDK5 regulatory subunit-associated protein 3-like isoform X3 n=1 Tax=Myxine glutinosa TaxID=7769 RepID=UPI00358DEC80